MRRKHNQWNDDVSAATFDPILPDETTQRDRTSVADLAGRTTAVETQMYAQYSAMAAYATIAQQGIDTVRAEARHELDRSQSTMIALLGRVRGECNDAIHGVEARLGGGPDGDAARLSALQQRVDTLESAQAAALESQRQLSDTVRRLLSEQMQRQGWLVSSGSADDLSLR